MILGILFWPWIGEVEIFAGFIFVSCFLLFFWFYFFASARHQRSWLLLRFFSISLTYHINE
jgi:hypothetical protein